MMKFLKQYTFLMVILSTVWLVNACGGGSSNSTTPPPTTTDSDRDNDGVADEVDAFPDDPAESVDVDKDGVGSNTDCNDNDSAISPKVLEVCGDSIDQDCNGSDKTCEPTEGDADGDGVKASEGDCNDNSSSVFPGATETCGDSIDQNCDGQDITCPETDDDGDGVKASEGDCNDHDAAINPSATEICDGKDNNCDGQIDEGVKQTFYPDTDKDDYGDADVNNSVQACDQPTGYVTDHTDCRDSDASFSPSAVEICGDAIDQNCDGIDLSCDQDLDAFTVQNGDCNDLDSTIYPGAPEVCGDGIDQDCDGQDLVCSNKDGDQYLVGEDCNDNDATIYPGAYDVVGDGIDGNCNRQESTDSQGYLREFLTQDAGSNGNPGFSGEDVLATSATFRNPRGIITDNEGNAYIADTNNKCVRRIDALTNKINTIVGTCDSSSNSLFPAGLALMTDNLYIADALNSVVWKFDLKTNALNVVAGRIGQSSYSEDNVDATKSDLNRPLDVAVDKDGNLYIADSFNHRIRKVAASNGMISTIVGTGTLGFSGDGKAPTTAEINYPTGIAVDDTRGNLFIADYGNSRIRKVQANQISTIAGGGDDSQSNGIPAISAKLADPGTFEFGTDVIVDQNGNLYFSDVFSGRIRMVNAATQNIVTVAGNGTIGNPSLGGAIATDSPLNYPVGLSLDATTGKLFIAGNVSQNIISLNP